MDADHIDRARQSNFFELTAIKECLVIYQGQPLGERDFAKNRAIRKGKSADCSDSLGDFNRLDKLMRVKSLVVDRSYGKAVVMRCNNDMLILAVFCADKYGVVADDLVFKTLRAALIVVFGTLNIGERRTLVPFFLFCDRIPFIGAARKADSFERGAVLEGIHSDVFEVRGQVDAFE